jgi:hypothetical protein
VDPADGIAGQLLIVVDELESGPPGLSDLVRTAPVHDFGTAATRTRRWLVGYEDPRWASEVTDAAMAELLELFNS